MSGGSLAGGPDSTATSADLVGVTEALDILGISRPTLHRWEASGEVRRATPGGPPRYFRAHLEDVARRYAASASRRAEDGETTRRRILQEAAALIGEQGPDACTLEAVARRAGLSRGGVIYHVRDKAELLRALAQAFVTDFEADWLSEQGRAEHAGGARLARSYVAATTRATEGGLAAAVLTSLMDAPDVGGILQRHIRGWYARLLAEDQAEGLHGEGLRRCLAADALWLLGLLHVPPMEPDQARELLDHRWPTVADVPTADVPLRE